LRNDHEIPFILAGLSAPVREKRGKKTGDSVFIDVQQPLKGGIGENGSSEWN
jgi:hypothetical protein